MSVQNISNNMQITVIGGGNIGTQFAAVCASKGYAVKVYSTKPERYNGVLEIIGENSKLLCKGRIAMATSDISEAISGSSIIFVAVPAMLFEQTAAKMLPYITPGVCIGVLPGSGGAEFAFQECIKKGAILFGLQRVPAVARLIEYGRTVHVEGQRDCLHLAAIPTEKASGLSEFMSFLFDMPCIALPNYLSVTMTPSNPILHTTRLCTMFHDYTDGMIYDKNPLFYGEWDLASSELLLACDQEHQNICRALSPIDLSGVHSLRKHYESETAEALTAKLCSIASLHNLRSPMIPCENGWIPDFSSRYFTADFPYGLVIIAEFADLAGVDVPNIKNTLDWYYRVSGSQQSFNLSKYGIHSLKDIYSLYLK